MLHIDRTTPLSFEFATAGIMLPDRVVIDHEDPRALALTELDMSRIELKPVLDVHEAHPTDLNEKLKAGLKKLETDGYIMLDAKVAEALMQHPELLSEEWKRKAEMGSEESGEVYFYGTVYRALDGSDALQVLMPFYEDGRWTLGHDDFYLSDERLANLAHLQSMDQPVRVVRYVAVYKGSILIAIT